jgi:hypothetical protein
MGNCLFYLTIKGGTYSMPKLNLGKVVGDKGDSFVFEDFTPEQLDGLTPKMLKGNATVDIRKDGLNNYIDFGIPRGKNGSEIKSISAENVEMADGNTLESAMTAANESIVGIEEPAFDDTTSTYTTLDESNTAAETTSNAIQSHTSIFSTLSNMKKSLSAIVQGLKILGTNVGGIHGISSALDSQREDIAASSKAVSVLNSNLMEISSTQELTNNYMRVFYSKRGQTISLYIEQNKAKLSYNTAYKLGTLPNGYCPLRSFANMVALGRDTPVMAYLSVAMSPCAHTEICQLKAIRTAILPLSANNSKH